MATSDDHNPFEDQKVSNAYSVALDKKIPEIYQKPNATREILDPELNEENLCTSTLSRNSGDSMKNQGKWFHFGIVRNIR